MANNPYVNKVEYGGNTIIDISDTTAVPADVAQGKYFYGADGEKKTGTATGGTAAIGIEDTLDAGGGIIRTVTAVDLSNDTVQANRLLQGYTAHDATGQPITGTYVPIINVGTLEVTPTEQEQVFYSGDESLDGYNEVIVDAIPSSYVRPSGTKQITANGTGIDVRSYASVDVSVGGGSSKNAQTAQSTTRATSTSYTEVISLICKKAGTYNVYWSTFRSSTSGTWGSQLYINDTAYGTAQTGSWSNHIQNIHLSSVTIAANAEVSVRVRSRASNYYGYVGTLTIIEA